MITIGVFEIGGRPKGTENGIPNFGRSASRMDREGYGTEETIGRKREEI